MDKKKEQELASVKIEKVEGGYIAGFGWATSHEEDEDFYPSKYTRTIFTTKEELLNHISKLL
jgi:hypothetical protein